MEVSDGDHVAGIGNASVNDEWFLHGGGKNLSLTSRRVNNPVKRLKGVASPFFTN